MKNQSGKMPDQVEWDFRTIADDQLTAVALFEYARTSKLRSPITKWLGTIDKGKTLSQLLIEEHKKGVNNYHGLLAKHQMGGLNATRNNFGLVELLAVLPYFPKPFLFYGRSPLIITYPLGKDRPKHLPSFSTVTIKPMLEVTARYYETHKMAPGTKMDLDLFGRSYLHDFKLTIQWEGFDQTRILHDFKKWLRSEAKNHPEKKSIGKRGQSKYWTLKALAALRIKSAGIDYATAQPILRQVGKDPYQILPIYAAQDGWDDAVRRAEKTLADLEAGMNPSGL